MRLQLTIAGLAATLPAFAASAACVTFDPPPAPFAWPCCGVPFVSDGVDLHTAMFVWSTGVPTAGGIASIVPDCGGDPGFSLNTNNVNVDVDVPTLTAGLGARKITFDYVYMGGNVNLMVNGHLEYAFDGFHLIPPASYAGVGAMISDASAMIPGGRRGTVTIVAAPGTCIDRLAIGGQELCIDDICAVELCAEPCPADLDGDGAVGFGDILKVLAAWGPCAGCPEDLDGNAVVDFGDLLLVLSSFGSC